MADDDNEIPSAPDVGAHVMPKDRQVQRYFLIGLIAAGALLLYVVLFKRQSSTSATSTSTTPNLTSTQPTPAGYVATSGPSYSTYTVNENSNNPTSATTSTSTSTSTYGAPPVAAPNPTPAPAPYLPISSPPVATTLNGITTTSPVVNPSTGVITPGQSFGGAPLPSWMNMVTPSTPAYYGAPLEQP